MKIYKSAALFALLITILTFGAAFFWLAREKAPTVPPVPKQLVTRGTTRQTQTNNEGSVEVSITPLSLDPKTEFWTFSASLNTHRIELGEDLAKQSFLTLGKDNEETALVWEGDPPGGHHRQGTLKFKKPQSRLEEIVLIIKNVAGIPERRFVWLSP